MNPTLYLLTGLPGAGKTTAAEHIEAITGAVRLTSDEVRHTLWAQPTFTEPEHQALYRFLNKETQRLLSSGMSVIYDANLNRFEHRTEKYRLAQKTHAKTVLIWVKTSREMARSRRINQTAYHHLVPRHETPASMFDRIATVFESPRADEVHYILDGTDITTQTVKQLLESAVL